ncbi:MAG: murein transglycosylase A [Desulfovibrio sp.]
MRLCCVVLVLSLALLAGCAGKDISLDSGNPLIANQQDKGQKSVAPEKVVGKGTIRYTAVPVQTAQALTKAMLERCEIPATLRELQGTLQRNLNYLSRKPKQKYALQNHGLKLTWGDLETTNAELLGLAPYFKKNPALLYDRFVWYKLEPGTLLTGYYEPLLEASYIKTGEYKYPLYGKPFDLQTADLGKFHPRWKGQKLVYRVENGKVIPYHSREEIDVAHSLMGKAPILAWTKSDIDVFFLQVQGSGQLFFPDGTKKHILYDGKNGRSYKSLGKYLINKGLVPKDEMSMQRIRKFLNDHPNQKQKVLSFNPSYVFFRLSDDGPFGSMAQALSPMRSVAVNRKVIPLGAPLVLDTDLPNGEDKTTPFTKIMAAQDTGGAIVRTRVDLFCGAGKQAEYIAGHLQAPSSVYFLVSKSLLATK